MVMKTVHALRRQYIGDGLVITVGLDNNDVPVCLVTMYGDHGGDDEDSWSERWMDDADTMTQNINCMGAARDYLMALDKSLEELSRHDA